MATTVLSLQDTHAVTLDVILEPTDWIGRYTHIEVWRSTLTEEGPYYPLFSEASGPSPAVVPEEAGLSSDELGALVSVQGMPFEVRINRSYTLSYISTDPDPVTKKQWALGIQAAIPTIRAWVSKGGVLGLTSSDSYGSEGSVEVLPTDAAALLGFPIEPPASLAYGKDPRLLIPTGATRVTVRDLFGQGNFFYKLRFYDRFTRAVSEFTPPMKGSNRVAGIPKSSYVKGYIKLLDGAVPAPNVRVSLYYPNAPSLVEGFLSVAQSTVRMTDVNGYAEFLVLRGVPVDVAVAGTNTVRRITIPTDVPVDSFNLFDSSLADNDAFGIQRRDVLYAERRNV